MLFSILIANYNNGHFFNDCYLSIINQTYKNWEVIIVDDCSNDDSVAVIKNIIGNDSRFNFFLNTENKGCGFTKNKCAKLAKGAILGFLDPDDALFPDALEEMNKIHAKDDKIAIVTSKYELTDLQMNFIGNANHGANIPDGKSYLTYGRGALTHFATFKRNKFELTKGIDEKMKRAVDQDLYYKLEELGKHVFLDKVLYRYRIHNNSISANQNLYKAQYWHFYTMLNAYQRRKDHRLEVNNFTVIEINKIKSNYYFSRFEKSRAVDKFCMKYYFLCKSILAFPRYKMRLKLKSFFT